MLGARSVGANSTAPTPIATSVAAPAQNISTPVTQQPAATTQSNTSLLSSIPTPAQSTPTPPVAAPQMGPPSPAVQSLAQQPMAAAQTPNPDAPTSQTVTGSVAAPPADSQGQSTAQSSPSSPDYADKLRQLRDYWTGKDDTKAAELNTQYLAAAQQKGQMAAVGVNNPADYATIQAKISMTAAHADLVEKGVKTIFDGFDKGGIQAVEALSPQIRAMGPEFANFDASQLAFDPSKQFVSVTTPDGSAVVFDRNHPKDFKLEPASELSIFRQGYLAQHPNAGQGEVANATSQYVLDMAKAKRSINNIEAVPRVSMIGTDGQGLPVFMNSHGGTPFQNIGGAQKPYTGVVMARSEGLQLGGNTPDPTTGLTPQQVQANAKQISDPTNIRTVQLINGVLPVAQKFRSAISQLPADTPIAGVTNILRGAGIQLNNKQINDFQTFATEFPREAQKAMVGSGATAQKSLDQQGELFTKAKTVGNLLSSLDIVTGILQDRKDGVTSPIYKPNNYQPPQSSPHQPQAQPQIDMSKPKNNGSVTGYLQPNGSIVDATGKRLN